MQSLRIVAFQNNMQSFNKLGYIINISILNIWYTILLNMALHSICDVTLILAISVYWVVVRVLLTVGCIGRDSGAGRSRCVQPSERR